jgi:outer membrane protein TolC
MRIGVYLSLIFLPLTSFAQMEVSLQEAIDMAVLNSVQLQQTQLQLQSEKALSYLSWRQWLPQVSFGYSESTSQVDAGADQNQAQWSVQGSQLIFDGGQGFVQGKLTQLAITEQERNYLLARDGVADQIFSAFHSLILLEEKAQLQRELVELSAEQETITNTEFSLGLITEVDRLETLLEFQSLEIDLKQTESELEQSYFAFKDALGLEIQTDLRVQGTVPMDYQGITISDDQNELLDTAVAFNGEIRSLGAQIESLRTQKGLYDMGWLPVVSLQGEAKLYGAQYPLDQWDYTLTLAVQLPIPGLPITTSLTLGSTPPTSESTSSSINVSPLPDLGFIAEGVQFRNQFSALSIQYEKAILSLQGQIAAISVQHRLLKESLVLQKEKQDIQARRLSIMQRQLELGEIKRVDFVKAQIALLEQEVSLREAIIQLMILERQVESLLGLAMGELTGRTLQ